MSLSNRHGARTERSSFGRKLDVFLPRRCSAAVRLPLRPLRRSLRPCRRLLALNHRAARCAAADEPHPVAFAPASSGELVAIVYVCRHGHWRAAAISKYICRSDSAEPDAPRSAYETPWNPTLRPNHTCATEL